MCIFFQVLVKLKSTIHGKGAVDKASLADSGLAFDSYGYNKGEDEELFDSDRHNVRPTLSELPHFLKWLRSSCCRNWLRSVNTKVSSLQQPGRFAEPTDDDIVEAEEERRAGKHSLAPADAGAEPAGLSGAPTTLTLRSNAPAAAAASSTAPASKKPRKRKAQESEDEDATDSK
jgi:hypothetical protein